MKCKSLKYNIISLSFIAVLIVIFSCIAIQFKKTGNEAYSYFLGATSGFAMVALCQAVRVFVMLKNSKYRKEQEIAQKDERIINLRNRSMAVSYYVTIIGIAVASIAFAIKGDMDSARNFSTVLSLSAVVYLIAYLVLSHKE